MGKITLDCVFPDPEYYERGEYSFANSIVSTINNWGFLRTLSPDTEYLDAVMTYRHEGMADTQIFTLNMTMPRGQVLIVDPVQYKGSTRSGIELFSEAGHAGISYINVPRWDIGTRKRLEIIAETSSLYPSLEGKDEIGSDWFKAKLQELWKFNLGGALMHTYQSDNAYYIEIAPNGIRMDLNIENNTLPSGENSLPKMYVVSKDAIFLFYPRIGRKENVSVGVYNGKSQVTQYRSQAQDSTTAPQLGRTFQLPESI